ncbi:MAG: T9SS type A sorting domain-containing protein [Bacteroidetes bacterium]|nr:T9SS type A sorting domain-containing protein [Bacteroidota bacterium]
MKKIFTFLFNILVISVLAQPTITKNDMPVSGDTIRTRSSMLGLGLNYQQAGNNITWDLSSLISTGIGGDTFVTVASTPLLYQLAFNLPWDPNKANLASPQTDISLIPNLPLTNIYNYYRSVTAAYSIVGFGATIAGLPLPIKFDNPDIWYKFPLTINSPADSSTASFAQGITGLGYLAITRKRVNQVDGWGTVITPAGSYTALRIKSIVQEVDSIYLDSLNMGLPIPRNYTEYKWLVPGKKIPVMQVTSQSLLTTFTWTDSSAVASSFSVDVGQDMAVCLGTSVQITANASGGTPPYTYIWSNGTLGQTISVTPTSTTTYNITCMDSGFQFAFNSVTITVLPNPVVNIDLNPNQTWGCSGGPIVTTFIMTANPAYPFYNWSDGSTGPGAAGITAGPPSPGFIGSYDYWVQVADNNGCLGQDSVTIAWDICSGINQGWKGSVELSMHLYPNPTSGLLFLDYYLLENQVINAEVFNSTGQSFGILPLKTSLVGNVVQSIDLKACHIPAGLLFIRFSSDKGTFIRPVMVE